MSVLTIASLSLAELFGDINFKHYARQGKVDNLVLGVVGYAVLIFFLIKALQRGNLIYVNGMWDGISAVLSTVVAYIFLKERLNSGCQWIGLALIIVGVFVLRLGGIPR